MFSRICVIYSRQIHKNITKTEFRYKDNQINNMWLCQFGGFELRGSV